MTLKAMYILIYCFSIKANIQVAKWILFNSSCKSISISQTSLYEYYSYFRSLISKFMEENLPFFEVNGIVEIDETGPMNRCSKVQVDFDVDETKWAKVEVTLRNSPSHPTIVYCKDERDTFNHILSSMDLGLDLDYYQLLGKP